MPEQSPPTYNIVVSKRARRLSLRIDHRGLSIVTPRPISMATAQQLLSKHADWIDKHKRKIPPPTTALDPKQDRLLRKQAKQVITGRLLQLATQHNFKYNHLSIRDQTTRWGSCSSRRNLSFSWRLILAPEDVLDYVLVHELAHTVHLNHSPAFWQLVADCLPGYQQPRQWLKQHGHSLR